MSISPRRFNELPLEVKFLAGFGLAMAILLAAGLLQDRTIQALVESDRRVAHAEAMIINSEGALADVQEAESSGRGYVATGDERFVTRVGLSIMNARAHLQALRNLSADYPGRQRNLDRLVPLTERKLAFMQQLIVVRREQGLSAAAGVMRQGEGLRMMDEIRELTEGREAEEGSLLESRLATSRAVARKARLMIALGTLLALGCVVAASGIVHKDVVKRKGAEEHLVQMEGRYRGLLEAAPDAMVVVNAGGEIVLVNLQAEKQFGYRRDELVGKHVESIIPEGFAERLIADALRSTEEAVAQQIGTGIELMGRRRDGSDFPIEIMLSPLKSDDGILVTAAIRNISARKAAEGALANRTRELEDSQDALGQNALELTRSNSELQQFAYVISHDLQEPLRTMASFAQLLQKRYQGKLDANADDFTRFIVDGASRMHKLINDLLGYSRVGSRRKDYVPTDCTKAFNQAVANLHMAVTESGAVVTHAPLPTVPCDEAQLIQVFQNLVGNGIKFRESAAPRVHVAAERRTSEWVFSVKDNGIGIDPQYFSRVFEVFQRLHNCTEYPGSGIGLAIAKKIVEQHGGRIWVESKLHQGATFFFTLPAGCGA